LTGAWLVTRTATWRCTTRVNYGLFWLLTAFVIVKTPRPTPS
jgi:succinate-acetate transporter protein